MRLEIRAVIACSVAVVAVAAPSSALGQTPTGDSVVGFSSVCSGTCWFGADAHSGPSGENPTGTGRFASGNHGLYLDDAPVTCLAVSGNEAAVGLFGPNNPSPVFPPGNYGVIALIQDNVPPSQHAGDAYEAASFPLDHPPTQAECAGLLPIGRELYVPTDPFAADFTVTDAPSFPTSKQQCANGGWQAFPEFESQFDCVRAVERWSRQECIFIRAVAGRPAFRDYYGGGVHKRHAMRRCIRDRANS
jgi:hypothetical protein